MTLEPGLEQQIIEARVDTAAGPTAALEPELHRKWINAMTNVVRTVQEQGHLPLILCSEAARPLVKGSTLREIPHLVVLSVPEIVPDVKIESLGEIRIEE
jgi:flagellar biosynthesis protein FlhA